MSPHKFYPKRSDTCQIGSDGTLYFSRSVMVHLGWESGDTIAVSFIKTPLTLLFHQGIEGYPLQVNNKSGFLRCPPLIDKVVFPDNKLNCPLTPIYPHYGEDQLGLILGTLKWRQTAFPEGKHLLPSGDTNGVYLLTEDGKPVYIGQGAIRRRFRTQLKENKLKAVANRFHWIVVSKSDAVVLERLLLADFEAHYRRLPRFNKRHY